MSWTTCEKCNRLLRKKDGPVCPDCKPKNAPKSDSKTDDKDAA